MAKRGYRKSKVGRHTLEPETLMLGFGFDPRLSEGSVKIPIFLTSTFAYKTAEEGKRLFDYMAGRAAAPQGADAGLIYTRFNNPNLQVVEERLAVLEPAEACAVFASGMAAILTSLLATVSPGQSVLRSTPLYGGTETLFDRLLASLGVKSARFFDGCDPKAVRAAAKAALKLGPMAAMFVETPANPTNSIVDLDLISTVADEIAAEQGSRPIIICDNTLLGPLYQSPLAHGTDLVVYSLTKYVGGHSDLVAGAALGSRELITRLKSLRGSIGNQLDVHSAWMITRSLETLRLRVDQSFANARKVADWLAKHPKVEKVFYPGYFAEGSREADVVARQCGAFGATFSFTVVGGRPAAFRALDRLQVFKQAVSLGGTESLACHPGSTTHSGVPEDDRRAIGISEGLIRLSTGVEAAKDLIADLAQALSAA
jgi:methionine-gamma-lyase